MSGLYSDYASWAAATDTQKVYTAELGAASLASASACTLYLATHSGVWDGGHFFEPCIKGLPRLRHHAQELTSGLSLVSYGDLELALQGDQGLDQIGGLDWDHFLSQWSLAGRDILIRVGGPELDYAEWGLVLRGYMGDAVFDDHKCSVPVFSRAQAILATEIPPAVYDASVATATVGRPVPLCYGRVRNITPKGLDSAGLVYQFHDPALGSCQQVEAVYVDGLPVTSGFTSNATLNTVTFGGDPGGRVTLDVRGARLDGVYEERPASIVSALLRDLGGVDSDDLDQASFAAHAAEVDLPVGLYVDHKIDLKRAIDSLCAGLLTTWGARRDGRFFIQRFTPATGAPALELSDRELLECAAAPEERLFWQATLAGERNWTTMTRPDEAVTPDRRQWLALEFRERQAALSDLRSVFPLAGATHQETHLADLEDCALAAGWWLELLGCRRRVFTCQVKMQPLQVELGQVVRLVRERWGLEQGCLGRVVSLDEDHRQSTITLEVWT